MEPVFLWTDVAMFLLVAALLAYGRIVARTPHLAATWRQAFLRPAGAVSATVLLLFATVGMLDSLHYRLALSSAPGEAPAWSARTDSALDALLAHLRDSQEVSYSRPLAIYGFAKQVTLLPDGKTIRRYPRLKHAGLGIDDAGHGWAADVAKRALLGAAAGLTAFVAMFAASFALVHRSTPETAPDGRPAPCARGAGSGAEEGGAPGVRRAHGAELLRILHGRTRYPVRAVLLTLLIACVLAGIVAGMATNYHVLGTDRTGRDLLYVVLKSIRTALVIGTMTTIFTLPLAVGLGLLAGYFRGWIDEAIQYLYTVVNSIPYVLLIAASVLMLMVFIDKHPDWFPTMANRTDARLFFLCVILGLGSWTDLCRLVRGEVLKLRELDFIQAAQAFGVPALRILRVHLLPNIMHMVLINVVIRFSDLVLAEATLSYVGIGVDPSMASFGTMINTARLELAREPVIWWTLVTAFTFMVTLVLSANYFADAVRDAFDPRAARR
ncbi:ABC transporter [Burkholderiales bacterium GJ-E10]|nr:ABC transporter [Burkholderiales bacterium GJ-E10]